MSTPSGTPENPFSDDRGQEDADRSGGATGGASPLPSYNAYAASGPTDPTNAYAAHMAGSAYPGPGARLGALLIDFVVVWILTGVIAVIFVDFSSITLAAQIGMQFISLVIWLAYRIGMEVTTGASLGKMALGLKVVDASGATLSAQDSLMRNLWYVVSTVVGMIPFLGWLLNLGVCIAVGVTISNDQFNQSFSDKWGKAYVVRSR
ncbi:RDD family protein [Corynebacterium variabile]|uniref:RDD family protein n=1 Tax=Corynebacterium variabile TaxID=1727 RepID=UPI0028A1A5C8|nr:RDD family protein [Corynebacterium variabile]